MSNRLQLFVPLVLFLLIASLFLVLQQRRQTGDYDPTALPSALVGKSLPAMELSTLAKSSTVKNTTELVAGQPFILNVWATWCIACRAEHAYLNQLDEAGVAIVGLNYKDEREAAQRWLQQLGNPYRFNLFDEDGQYGLELGVYGAPESYIVDAGGIVRYRHVGVLNQRVWDKYIAPLGLSW